MKYNKEGLETKRLYVYDNNSKIDFDGFRISVFSQIRQTQLMNDYAFAFKNASFFCLTLSFRWAKLSLDLFHLQKENHQFLQKVSK